MSSWGTVAEMSSTHAKRWVMLPKPSSPAFPARSLSWARLRRMVSSGWRTRFMTSAAKVDDRGQPWLTPSCMEMFFQVVLLYLKCTVAGAL